MTKFQNVEQAVNKAAKVAVEAAATVTVARRMVNVPKPATVGKDADDAEKHAATIARVARVTLTAAGRTNAKVRTELREAAKVEAAKRLQDKAYVAKRIAALNAQLKALKAL